MLFKQNFSVHPVGQGLFYSGTVSLDQMKFRFVFDCGSLTRGAGQKCVDRYIKSLHYNDPIDLLVISHFDADHVNQIGRLLQGIREVKNLVMPFLGFNERLVLALRAVFKCFQDNDPIPDGDVISLIVDPIRHSVQI